MSNRALRRLQQQIEPFPLDKVDGSLSDDEIEVIPVASKKKSKKKKHQTANPFALVSK